MEDGRQRPQTGLKTPSVQHDPSENTQNKPDNTKSVQKYKKLTIYKHLNNVNVGFHSKNIQ